MCGFRTRPFQTALPSGNTRPDGNQKGFSDRLRTSFSSLPFVRRRRRLCTVIIIITITCRSCNSKHNVRNARAAWCRQAAHRLQCRFSSRLFDPVRRSILATPGHCRRTRIYLILSVIFSIPTRGHTTCLLRVFSARTRRCRLAVCVLTRCCSSFATDGASGGFDVSTANRFKKFE